jgi:hypothetical protein
MSPVILFSSIFFQILNILSEVIYYLDNNSLESQLAADNVDGIKFNKLNCHI